MHLLHRSNDTGHWRGSNDSQKIPVRIVSGDSPPKLSAGTARPAQTSMMMGRIMGLRLVVLKR